jgi:hypothetical protein
MEFQYLVYYGSEGVDEIFVRLYRGGVVSTNLCWHLGEQRWVRRDLMNTRRGSEWGWPVYARSDRHVCEFALPAGANLPEDTYWAVMTMRAYNQTFFVMSHAGGCAIKSYAWFRVDSTPPMITITYPTNAATVGQVLQMTGTIVDRP